MKGRPQDFMSVGIVHCMAFPEAMKPGGPMVETIRKLCTDDYFETLEVAPIAEEAVREAAIQVVKSARKRVTLVGQVALLGAKKDLNSLDPSEHRSAVDLMRGLIPQATEWGAEALSVMSGPTCSDRAVATAVLTASLKELCEFSRRLQGPAIILETFDRVDFGKNCLMGPTVEAAALANKIMPVFPRFGLLLDLSHLPLLGEKPDHAVKAAGEFLKQVHIGNCVMREKGHPAYGDNHPPFGIPEGENGADELAAFLKALLESGYIGEGKRNIVSFEVKPFGDWTTERVIENAKQTLDEAWKAL
jgi:sugar phosphate isomerase/epimerase